MILTVIKRQSFTLSSDKICFKFEISILDFAELAVFHSI